MSTESQDEDDFATILKRNTYNRFSSGTIASKDPIKRRITISQSLSLADKEPVYSPSCKLNPKAFNTLNSFNEDGHLSRQVFKDHGENHLTSDDIEKSFGQTMAVENPLEVTAITATTIATCISSILRELIVTGEKLAEEGHLNAEQYDIFCGGGKNFRSRPTPLYARQKSQSSFQSSSSQQSSPKSLKKAKLAPLPSTEPIPTVQAITSFVAKLVNDTQTEYECIIISLIYVRRLIRKSEGQVVLLKENWKGIILSCIVLANKVWDDFHMQNLDYCYVFKGLTVERVNALELQLLISIDNRCNVSPSVYAQTHFEIQAMITVTKVEKVKPRNLKDRFSSKITKVHADERADEHMNQIETVNISNTDHPSPYQGRQFFGIDSIDKRTESEGEGSSDNSAHLSVDEYTTVASPGAMKIPAPVFTEGDDPDAEIPVGRKKLVQSVDLEKQKRNLRVLIHFEEGSLITEPPPILPEARNITGESNLSRASMLSRASSTNSLKLIKQHSRKSLHGPGVFTSPLQPIPSASQKVETSCFPFRLCRGSTRDVI